MSKGKLLRKLYAIACDESEEYMSSEPGLRVEPDEQVMESLYNEIVKKHELVNSALGLHEGNDYRIVVEQQMTEKYFREIAPEVLVNFLTIEGVEIDYERLLVGPKKQRITRYLSNSKSYRERVDRASYWGGYGLDKFPEDEVQNMLDRHFESHIRQLGETFKGSKVNIVISTNPIDLLFPSNFVSNESYSSCYHVLSDYHSSAPSSYAMTPEVVLIMTTSKNIEPDRPISKNGRSWAYVHPVVMATNRRYGAITIQTLKTAREEMQRRIGGKWIRKAESSLHLHQTSGYTDSEHSLSSVDGFCSAMTVEFSPSVCFVCGEDHEIEVGNACEDCSDRSISKCSCCGHTAREGERYYDEYGEVRCEDCFFEDYTYCDDCGERVRRDESHSYRYDFYCSSCFYNNYVYCDCCEGVISINSEHYVSDYNGNDYCEQCASEELSYCDKCGEYVKNDCIEDSICEDCREEIVNE